MPVRSVKPDDHADASVVELLGKALHEIERRAPARGEHVAASDSCMGVLWRQIPGSSQSMARRSDQVIHEGDQP